MQKIAELPDTDVPGIGQCPPHLAHLTDIWTELSAAIPPGVVVHAHRLAAELLVRLLAKMRDGTLTASETSQLRQMQSEFGLTPDSRARLLHIAHNAAMFPGVV